MMVEQRITLRFITPAFLGDADQRGAWRTPPFKALLRQWWRIVAAGRCGYDHRRLREEEGRLFGHAWLKDEAGRAWALRSRLRLRLEGWAQGQLSRWPPDLAVRHPEVQGGRVRAHLYLGYGPLEWSGEATRLRVPPAINAGAEATFVLAYPDVLRPELTATLQLITWFGTVGGRSRNGWGSLGLTCDGVKGLEGLQRDDPLLAQVVRPWEDCLRLDWPHALGRDEQGLLVWRTSKPEKWMEIMKRLAEVKIAFRTQFPLDQARLVFQNRHLLAYPVTNHGILEWSDRDDKTGKPKLTQRGRLKQTERLANQLRFKVLQGSEGCLGMIAHVPCGLPQSLGDKLGSSPSPDEQKIVWQKVHSILDKRTDFRRIEGRPNE